MGKPEVLKLQKLTAGIGRFIRYWGFRKIHGEIWALVYLTAEPLSGMEIGKALNVSKALVSPALKELETEGLIVQTESENSKTKRYIAVDDVTKIIQGVLKRREVPMIDKIRQHHGEVLASSAKNKNLNFDRLQKMGTMIQMAQMGLEYLVESNPFLEE